MAGLKISELTELTTPDGSEELVFAKNNQNGKIKLSTIAGSSGPTVDLLIVAGGGAGGSAFHSGYNGGGGGGGDVIQCYNYLLDNTSYCVVVGTGGVGTRCCRGQTGNPSCFGDIVAYGGGGGGLGYCTSYGGLMGLNGGNGGGGGSTCVTTLCYALGGLPCCMGNMGGRGLSGGSGGGGGAGGVGGTAVPYGSGTTTAGVGGPGIRSKIPGKCDSCLYGTGGSGYSSCNCGLCYPGGGFAQGNATYYGGGGGGASMSCPGGAGCVGIVYVRYKTGGKINSSTGGNSCYECNGYCIHEFTSNGTFSIS